MFRMKRTTIYAISWLLLVLKTLIACNGKSAPKHSALKETLANKKRDYIREIEGDDEEVSRETMKRGKVMLSYSDCYTCHREDRKAIGPSFRDIDLRYPRKQVFIRVVAQRIIHGGSGSWGYSVMSAHPKLLPEDAEAMVTYILSSSIEDL